MAGVTQRRFAELAGVTPPAVCRAVRVGHVVREAGLVDPDHPQNAWWITQHREGYDARARRLDTYRWPERDPAPEAPAALFEDWRMLPIDVEAADRLLRLIVETGGSQLGFVVAMLEGLRSAVAKEFDALWAELHVLKAGPR